MLERIRFFGLHVRGTVMTRSLCLLAATAVYLTPILAKAGSVAGSMELVCIPPVGLDIHLTDLPNSGTLLLRLWATPINALEKHKSLPVTATWCTAPDKCETAKGTAEFKHLNLEKNASGSYRVQFSDGHKEEGSFTVVRRQQHRPFLCE